MAKEPLEAARRHLAAGELRLAFDAFGQALLASPLDPAPVESLEEIATVLGAQGALADLYARLLQENPAHPSLGTLTRRIGRLRAMVVMAAPAAGDLGADAAPPRRDEVHLEEGREVVPSLEALGTAEGLDTDLLGEEVLPFGEEESELRETLAQREAAEAGGLAEELFGSDSEGEEAIDYELGAMLTSTLGQLPAEAEDEPEEAKPLGAGDIDREAGPGKATSSVAAVAALLFRRGLASGLDTILLGLVSATIIFVGTSAISEAGGGPIATLLRGPALDGALLRAAILVTLLLAFVYLTLCWSMGGRTLGGYIAGVQVVDRESGGGMSVGRAAIRAAAAVLGSLAFLIGPLWALFDPSHDAIHDKLAGTSVVLG